MAQNASMLAKSSGPHHKSFYIADQGRKKKRHDLIPLFFSLDARALRTPFRADALQTIYEIAHRELGDNIESAVVLTNVDYEEPNRIMLVLAVWADIDKDEWSRADKAIHNAVFEQEASWTEDELDDYLNTIHYEILPLRV